MVGNNKDTEVQSLLLEEHLRVEPLTILYRAVDNISRDHPLADCSSVILLC